MIGLYKVENKEQLHYHIKNSIFLLYGFDATTFNMDVVQKVVLDFLNYHKYQEQCTDLLSKLSIFESKDNITKYLIENGFEQYTDLFDYDFDDEGYNSVYRCISDKALDIAVDGIWNTVKEDAPFNLVATYISDEDSSLNSFVLISQKKGTPSLAYQDDLYCSGLLPKKCIVDLFSTFVKCRKILSNGYGEVYEDCSVFDIKEKLNESFDFKIEYNSIEVSLLTIRCFVGTPEKYTTYVFVCTSTNEKLIYDILDLNKVYE